MYLDVELDDGRGGIEGGEGGNFNPVYEEFCRLRKSVIYHRRPDHGTWPTSEHSSDTLVRRCRVTSREGRVSASHTGKHAHNIYTQLHSGEGVLDLHKTTGIMVLRSATRAPGRPAPSFRE